MPIHDWSRVDRSLYHDFYLDWNFQINRCLNNGVLPSAFYSMSETVREDTRPLFIELPEGPDAFIDPGRVGESSSRSEVPPRAWLEVPCVSPEYADRVISIRRCDCHSVVAAIRIVAPDDKRRPHRFSAFVGWAAEVIRAGVALLVVDLFPTERELDISRALWDEFVFEDLVLPTNKLLTLLAFSGGRENTAYVEPISFENVLPAMPLFLNRDLYVLVPLEATYQASWQSFPDAIKGMVPLGARK